MIVAGADGLVVDLAVPMRPWTVVGLFRDAMLVATGATFDANAWALRNDEVSAPNASDGIAGLGGGLLAWLSPSTAFFSHPSQLVSTSCWAIGSHAPASRNSSV